MVTFAQSKDGKYRDITDPEFKEKCLKYIIGDDCRCPECIEDSAAEAEYRRDCEEDR